MIQYAQSAPGYAWHIYENGISPCKFAPRGGVVFYDDPPEAGNLCKICAHYLAQIDNGLTCPHCGSHIVVIVKTHGRTLQHECKICKRTHTPGARPHRPQRFGTIPIAHGERLRDLRVGLGVSQKRLEQMSGVRQSTISCIERGLKLIAPSVVSELAKVFDMSDARFLEVLSAEQPVSIPSLPESTRVLDLPNRDEMNCASPEHDFVASLLRTALIDTEDPDPRVAAEARFWLRFGEGADIADLAGVHGEIRRALGELPPIPGTSGNNAVELARLARWDG